MLVIKRMLVPTDFSPASDIALRYAIDLAIREDCGIRLLHVIDESNFTTAYADGFYVEQPQRRSGLIEDATKRLEGLASQCRTAGVPVTIEVAVGGAARVIAETATLRGTDLIVMGTHGRNAFAHLVLGSVAERIVRTAPCPVLTVRDTSRVSDALTAASVGHCVGRAQTA